MKTEQRAARACEPEQASLLSAENQGDGTLVIREFEFSDIEATAALCDELGYPVSVSTLEQRMRKRADLRDRIVYVACHANTVVGWIEVGEVHHLQADAYGEIGGLVVASECRGEGIGARLVRRAEQWTRERGLSKIVVRSQIARERAHRFYLREEYERTKTSAVFSKMLASDSQEA